MLKTAAFFALCLALVHTDCIASPVNSKILAAVAASKQIYGKGVHNQCLPYALALAQVLHDRYKVSAVGIVYTWLVPGFPVTIGRHIVVAYTTKAAGVSQHWIVDNETKYPLLVKGENAIAWISAFNCNGTFTIDRILQLPLTNLSDREYIGGALMAGLQPRQPTSY
jgi:hypothetical protein